MQFFKLQFLIAFLFGVAVVASPAPVLDAREAAVTELLEARADITSFLGQLTGILPALLQLLNAQTLNNIGSLVNNAAYLLDQPTTNQTKTLLGTVSGLLESLTPLLDGLSTLLTADLISKIGSLLNAVFSLLTPEFIAQITGLINDVAPLISAVAQLITGLISAVLGG